MIFNVNTENAIKTLWGGGGLKVMRVVTEKHIINFLALIYNLSLQSDKTKDQNGTTGDKKIGELKTEPKKEEKKKVFLAHLWGAYAIPVALSGVRRPSFVVRRPSYVVCRLCPP